ncbi:peptidyl-tRNA hydrolase [Arboricoccus pini]|uniref:Peptidyl-tRNA hydrolase n=1 Tax=Arboricoccus pini TaxID=1963835 RepID=A0A212QT59_9PROT|nr:peptidyl-tRNA hydrolase [Arboricoccus pini]
MRLFVGLGNPGAQYAGNRHNIGFMALDRLAEKLGGRWRSKYQGRYADIAIGGERVLLLEPLTFMNESGRSVAAAYHFHKLHAADVIVFHDELDLAPGKLRVKEGGGTAGHNGLRSIEACIGTRAFKRVRLGIGHPGHKDRVLGHVLGDFSKVERTWLDPFLDALVNASPLLAQGQDAAFMSKVALATQPPKKIITDKPADSGS